MQLGQGSALLYSDRTEAQKQLEQAKASYQRVEAADDSLLKTRARLGLAKVYESLCKPEEALKYYEQVAASEKDSAIGKSAAEAAERLKNQEEGDFLEWFAKQTPKRPAPLPGVGGNVPGMPGMPELSSSPNIGLTPGILDGAAPGATPGLPPPADAAPAAAAAKTDEPTNEPKADDAKNDDAKSGDAKPAESKAEATKADATKAESTKPGEPPAKTEAAPSGAADKKSD
jgi:tetratricopeptide (TPR) repeat protein